MIIKKLAAVKRTTAAQLAQELGVSEKTIYKDIAILQSEYKDGPFQVQSQPHYGIYLRGDENEALKISQNFERASQVPNSDRARVFDIYHRLLRTNDFISPIWLAQQLHVSERTIERNVAALSAELQSRGVVLEKNQHSGLKLKITEEKRRSLMFQLLNKYWGQSWKISENGQQAAIKFDGLSENARLISEALVQKLTEILNQFSEQNKFKFSDFEFQSLVIHLAIAISRVQQGQPLTKRLGGSEERQRVNAKQLSTMIKSKLGVTLPPQETDYIQLHLIAASTSPEQMQKSPMGFEIRKLLKGKLENFGYDDQLLQGLVIHLLSTIKRLEAHMSISNPYTAEIKQNYQQAFEMALQLVASIESQYSVRLDDDEAAYLALHIEAYLERKRFDRHVISAAIVCSTGQGSAQLLAAKIRNEFPQIKIQGIWAAAELETQEFSQVDCIISTIKVEIMGIPTILVSPFVTQDDQAALNNFIQANQENNSADHAEFDALVSPELTWARYQAQSRNEVLQMISQELVTKGYARAGIFESALAREKVSSTSFEMYALPHADPDFVIQPVLAVCTLEQPVKWGTNEVAVIFFLAMDKTKSQAELDLIFDYFYRLTANKRLLQKLSKITDRKELYQAIRGEN
ncbi:BglG family transcription antiterminator [Ligilactobacillus salitolerans]|nr:PRD domain-containing protein [Ligilactobacillus salitolerans]